MRSRRCTENIFRHWTLISSATRKTEIVKAPRVGTRPTAGGYDKAARTQQGSNDMGPCYTQGYSS
eukprot:3366561-Amphidinium_carterae.1